MKVFIDLTELFAQPHRTGIQRVCAELCLNWDNRFGTIEVCVFGPWVGLAKLPSSSIRAIKDYFSADETERRASATRLRWMGRLARWLWRRADIRRDDVVLVPEVFYDRSRLAFYDTVLRKSRHRVGFLVFDMLPLIMPESFALGTTVNFFRYVQTVSQSRNLAFISARSADDMLRRFLRRPIVDATVVQLGSNALQRERPKSRSLPEVAHFVYVGTIEPRKSHALILSTFKRLWAKGCDAKLTFVGRLGWVDKGVMHEIKGARCRYPMFHWRRNADDDTVTRLIRGATATLFVSEAEGYGLPPVESLWLGTPCIVSKGTPSLEVIGEQGVLVLDRISEETLQQAVIAFLERGFAEKKTQEALSLELPTWEGFAEQAGSWAASFA